MDNTKIKNSEIGGLVTAFVLVICSCTGSSIPFVFSFDMMQWGYGLICISGFVFIMGIVTFLMYFFRYMLLASVIRGDNNIVHWIYPKELIEKRAQIEFENAKSENKIKLGIVWFFFIFFTGLFLIIGFSSGEEDSMGAFFILMMSIALIITLVSVIMPYVFFKKAMNSSPDVIIATNGMYYLGQLHTWNRPLFFIDRVDIHKDKNELEFRIKYFTKLGWYRYDVYSVTIEIPKGQMQKAEEVVEKLNPK